MRIQNRHLQECVAMTLVEFLFVIFVIGLLFALIHPFSLPHRRPVIPIARLQIAQLTTAIEAYEAEYDHLPFADSVTNEDVTCGIDSAAIQDFTKVDGIRLIMTNSDLIVVLMDFDLGVNAGHKLNPKQVIFLNARMVNDTKSPGVSTVDHQFRDPWGNPYVVSLDANHDGFVRDACYAHAALYVTAVAAPLTNHNGVYEFGGKAMVWSRGPDGKASSTAGAEGGVNKDNVVSWR